VLQQASIFRGDSSVCTRICFLWEGHQYTSQNSRVFPSTNSLPSFLLSLHTCYSMSFLHPRDPRWQGRARWYPVLDLVKTTTLFLFTMLVAVEGALYRHWYMAYHSTVEPPDGEIA
jgi:hypothetical protein